jgi:hypothetical protein
MNLSEGTNIKSWRWVKPLKDLKSIKKAGKQFGIKYPKSYINTVKLYNAGRPPIDVYDTNKVKERLIKGLLSFNYDDVENVYDMFEIVSSFNDELVPFALDDFGNYLCFSKKSDKLFFLDNDEPDDEEIISNNFEEFLNIIDPKGTIEIKESVKERSLMSKGLFDLDLGFTESTDNAVEKLLEMVEDGSISEELADEIMESMGVDPEESKKKSESKKKKDDDEDDDEEEKKESVEDFLWEDVSIAVPGGDSERPKGARSDVNISIPSKTEISVDQYNDALSSIKKSFKEGVELLEILETANVSQVTLDELQEDYTIAHIFESYMTGPYMESLDKSHRTKVNKIIRSIVKNQKKAANDKYGLTTFFPRISKPGVLIGSQLGGVVGGIIASANQLGATVMAPALPISIGAGAIGAVAGGLALGSAKIKRWMTKRMLANKYFQMHLWQMLGTFTTKRENLEKALDYYRKKYEEELEDYTFNAAEVNGLRFPSREAQFILLVDDNKARLASIKIFGKDGTSKNKKDDDDEE